MTIFLSHRMPRWLSSAKLEVIKALLADDPVRRFSCQTQPMLYLVPVALTCRDWLFSSCAGAPDARYVFHCFQSHSLPADLLASCVFAESMGIRCVQLLCAITASLHLICLCRPLACSLQTARRQQPGSRHYIEISSCDTSNFFLASCVLQGLPRVAPRGACCATPDATTLPFAHLYGGRPVGWWAERVCHLFDRTDADRGYSGALRCRNLASHSISPVSALSSPVS